MILDNFAAIFTHMFFRHVMLPMKRRMLCRVGHRGSQKKKKRTGCVYVAFGTRYEQHVAPHSLVEATRASEL